MRKEMSTSANAKAQSTILAVVVSASILMLLVFWLGCACASQQSGGRVAVVVKPTRSLSYVSRIRLNDLKPGEVVPKIIWQTWHTLTLPPGMAKTVKSLQAAHPDFVHVLMDEAMCYDYILTRFPKDVARAFTTLRPGAYKADLWRLCVLYMDGGIYLDIKYNVVAPFTFDALLDKTQFVRDRTTLSSRGVRHGLYNALMACEPKDPRILACIEHIVQNVQTRYYGMSCLEPTGPVLVAKHIDTHGSDVTMQYGQTFNTRNDTRYIRALSPLLRAKYGRKRNLLQCYPGYTKEQDKTQTLPHYSIMWRRRDIYEEGEQMEDDDFPNQGTYIL